ncbi:TraR/DksA family transcriptional regulator [Bacteriovoracaceae bacterium]|nr:TraR/DksA family transcriptional regulator [Bacteriovoracaceae bacterium]
MNLDNYKQSLTELKNTLQTRIAAISKDKTRADSPISADFAEQAVDLENNEVLDALDTQEREELKLILQSLKKIDEGTFGKCVSCGDEIGDKRLQAVPYAQNCITCQE